MTKNVREMALYSWAVEFISSTLIALLMFMPDQAQSEPMHGISMYGTPRLPHDFVSLPYANPNAPKGGEIVFGEVGGFDSMNPYILKGRAPWGIRSHVYETLLGRNYDEPFSLYGLLAETIEVGANRGWVEFTLRAEAKFSDGSPVTVEDVIWSFQTLAQKGVPRYANSWAKVESAKQTGPRSVRFTFNAADRELPLILGLRPVLRKKDWADRDFAANTLDIPVGSGPYIVADFETNRSITFQRNPDYWGAAIPFNKGRHNLSEIRYDYYGDSGVVFEAFKAGEMSTYREGNAGKWLSNYDFPAVNEGRIIKAEIPHQRPSGMTGFVMNTRLEKFSNWRVREALIQAFNYEFINKTLNGGSLPRIESYFSNSELGMGQGAASDKVQALLEPFKGSLLPGALEGYALPVSDGSERNRKNLRQAKKLLEQAGWSIQDGVLKNESGTAFSFTILLKNANVGNEAIANIYRDALQRLGIAMDIQLVDSAQHRQRLINYDFDMVYFARPLSLSPGNEQTLYWGAGGVKTPGTRNYMGMNAPAAEAMIKRMLSATDHVEFVGATKALDRVLTSGRYVIPIWFSKVSRLAHKSTLHYPENLPIYGDWVGFLPDVWWAEQVQ